MESYAMNYIIVALIASFCSTIAFKGTLIFNKRISTCWCRDQDVNMNLNCSSTCCGGHHFEFLVFLACIQNYTVNTLFYDTSYQSGE